MQVQREHEDVVPDGVASPALERPTVLHGARPDVLGVVDRTPRGPRDEEEVVRVRRAVGGREEVVGDRVLVCPVPIIGHLVPVELGVGPRVAVGPRAEAVLLTPVPAVECGGSIVGEVAGQPVGAPCERNLGTVRDARRRPLDAREPPEQVVEAPVLKHDVHHPFDRPSRFDRGGGVRDVGDDLAAGAREQGAARNGHRRSLEEPAAGDR